MPIRLLAPCCMLLLAAALAAGDTEAQNPAPAAGGVATLDLEELAQLRVTSVAKRAEPISQAPAAITVITREDIRRSGASTIPEALRLVPGLDVARVGARDWAISSRGFNDQASNKLLVLIDGRAIYSPLFAGVFWDSRQLLPADVDRIEVIRGPGATLWGSNAVNGVINVITRPAGDTKGGLAFGLAGTGDQAAGLLRYGLGLGANAAARVYVRALQTVAVDGADSMRAPEDWQIGQAGFRADWQRGPRQSFTLQGNLYRAGGAQRYTVPSFTAPYSETADVDISADGLNVLGRWDAAFGRRSDVMVQAYIDRAVRRQPHIFGRFALNTVDVEVQLHRPVGARHDVVAGAGYRRSSDEISGDILAAFVPPSRATDLVTAFVQDEIALVRGRLALTVGSKVEHNAYSGFELQPNARLIYTPRSTQTLWAAVSRAVRSPSRVDSDISGIGAVVPGSPLTAYASRGNPDFRSEILIAYEAGYRALPRRNISLDFATFYNDYHRVRSLRMLPPETAGGVATVPFLIGNDFRGHTYGAEASVAVQVTPGWRLRGYYTFLKMKVEPLDTTVAGLFSDVKPGLNPEHQVSLWSSLDLPHRLELDVIGRYVSALSAAVPAVPHYVTADVQLAWHVTPRGRLTITGQDLLHHRHVEFQQSTATVGQRQILRRVYGKVVWEF